MFPVDGKTVKKVSATELRDNLKDIIAKAKGSNVVLVENRRQKPKYLVDKEWFDNLVGERNSATAAVEVLADQKLMERLLKLSRSIDADVRTHRLHTNLDGRAMRLYSMEEVFGEK